MSEKVVALVTLTVCLAAGCGGRHASVELELAVSEAIDDATLAEARELRLTTTGDESYDGTVALDRGLDRVERTVYRPGPRTRTIAITVDALDEEGRIVAEGSTGSIAIDGRTSVHVVLGRSAGDLDAARPTYADVVLADRPLGYWRLEETSGSVFSDSSGNGDPALLAGSTWQLGQPGALSDGSSRGVRLPTNDQGYFALSDSAAYQLDGRTPFTLEAWVAPDTLDAVYHEVVTVDDGATPRTVTVLYFDGAHGTVLQRTIAGVEVACQAPAPAAGRWTHVVGTYDGDQMNVYLDGERACTKPDARSFPRLGATLLFGNGFDGWHPYAGLLDEVALYDHALGPDRVAAHSAAAR